MFHWVEARAFAHATEDEEKVLAALKAVLPGEPKREALEGHYGNPLISLVVRAEKTADIREFWRRLVAGLGREDVGRELEERIDEDGVYHLRLDKQRAFLGEIARPTGSDVIDVRAKVAAFPNKRENAVRVVREFLEAL